MSSMPKLWLFSGIVTSGYLFPNLTTQAQVIPDGTTPTNIAGDCLVKCDLTGGIQAESNLFHSFREFNIGTGESIYFVDPGVANIFSRVTGNNSSEIFGNLGVTGNANLWLINPQGILFGNGATLDINGSFVATTADEIVFSDRGVFSTNSDTQENLPLLTVNPSAFFYRQRNLGNPITVEETSLAIPTQESLVLLGAQNTESTNGVFLKGATIEAPQGNIQIGAVTTGGIVEINPELQLQFPVETTGGNITLVQGSEINVNGIGGGAITVRGAELNILENSLIRSATLGNIDSGDIKITTQKLNLDRGLIHSLTFGSGKSANITINTTSLNLSGDGITEFQESVAKALEGNLNQEDRVSGIITSSNNLGAAGKITIDTESALINNGGFVATVTYDSGKGGDIDINTTEAVNLSNSGLLSLSAFGSSGKTGDLALKAQKLTVRDGSFVSTATLGRGIGGNITIQAEESVTVSQTPANSVLPTAIFTNSVFPNSGDAGNLVIDTKNLIIKNGAQISSASGLLTEQGIIPFGGTGGDINIRATESVTISGSSANGIFPSTINSDTRSNNPAGNININTGAFLLEDRALVSASSIGTGDGGNLTINATESIDLKGSGEANLFQLIQSSFSAENFSIPYVGGSLLTIGIIGNAQNITLKTPKLSLHEGALISTSTLGTGNAGNLKIEASQIIEVDRSFISSTSLSIGNAGNIEIDTGTLKLSNGGTLVTSSLGFGKAGDMTINATELIELSNDRDYTTSFPLQGGIITSKVGAGTTGAGNLFIKTKNLVIQDGLDINISNDAVASFLIKPEPIDIDTTKLNLPPSRQVISPPSNSVIQATESIILSGSSADGQDISSINSSTETHLPANNVRIVTPQLTMSEGADISVSSQGSGAAGSLEIIADRVDLKTGATLNASTLSGKGGNINLQIADTIQLSDRAMIATNASNQGNGGNINIDTDFLIAFPYSSITANAIAGKGGNINLRTQDIFVASLAQISATSQLGIDGEVTISTFTSDLRNNLAKLPERIQQTKNQIVSRCGTGDELGEGNFVYIGRGALPPNPLEGKIEREGFFIDWGTETTQMQLSSLDRPQNSKIIEATGWELSDRGKIILTAKETANNLTPDEQTECPFKQ